MPLCPNQRRDNTQHLRCSHRSDFCVLIYGSASIKVNAPMWKTIITGSYCFVYSIVQRFNLFKFQLFLIFRLLWTSDVVSSVYVDCNMDTKITPLCYTAEYFAQARSDYPRLH